MSKDFGDWEHRSRDDLRRADGSKINCAWDSMTLMDSMVKALHGKDFKFEPQGIALGENKMGNTALIVFATKNEYGININIVNEHKAICFNAGPLDEDNPRYDQKVFSGENCLREAHHFFVKMIKEAEEMDSNLGGYGV